MTSCGREDCASPCHTPGTPGPYCAPARCYCGGCPAYVPLPPRGQPYVEPLVPCLRCQELAPAQQLQLGVCLDCQALRRRELLTERPPLSPPADAVPLAQAPAVVAQVREQLALATAARRP